MTKQPREFSIGPIKIGMDHPPLVIAEMSGNHNQSLERALKIVDAAAEAGAHALKIQTYTADTMTLNLHRGEFSITDQKSLWKGKTLYDLYREAHTPWEWHGAIFDQCRKRGMIGFSTPFDRSSVDFLEGLHVPVYKIASFEIIDLPLIAAVARTRKPLIMSTGMASLEEIEEAVATARDNGAQDIVVLKCTSSYPATPRDARLSTMEDMAQRLGVHVGLSDHTAGIGVSVAAAARGARVIEKHFTLSRSDGGVDSAFSLEPDELKALVVESKRAWEAMSGSVQYGPSEHEKASLVYRRSLYVSAPLKKGDVLTESNVRSVRPGLGLSPKYFKDVIGKKAARDLEPGTPLSWDVLHNS